jgi:hypothetical protein
MNDLKGTISIFEHPEHSWKLSLKSEVQCVTASVCSPNVIKTGCFLLDYTGFNLIIMAYNKG